MKIRLRDFNMACDDSGGAAGRTLVCIHGYPLSRAMWAPQLAGLADTARVIAPDLRGFGESEATPGPYSMDLLADDCRELLDKLGVTGPVVLCGLSMGGYIAFAFWRRYPERVSGLILAATRAGPDTPAAQAARDAAAALAREKGVAAIVEQMLPKMLAPAAYNSRPDLVAQTRRLIETASVDGIVGALMGMKTRPDSVPTLATIDKPALIVYGADDQFLPLAEAEVMRAAIRRSRLEVLPAAGHLLNLEQAEKFNEVVRDFIRRDIPPAVVTR